MHKSQMVLIGAQTTVWDAFNQAVERCPDTCALVLGSHQINYREFSRLVERCAAALVARGIKRGDRVAILSPPRPEVLITMLAAMKLGAIAMGLGTRLMGAELEHVLRNSAPSIVLAVNSFEGRDYSSEVRKACGTEVLCDCFFTPDPNGLAPEFIHWLGLLPLGAGTLPDPVQPADCCAIIYTSGTTGPPKGAMISHQGLLTAVQGMLEQMPLDSVRAVSMLPIDHVGFLHSEFLLPIIACGTNIQLPRFDSAAVLEAVQTQRATLWLAIPTMLQRLLASADLARYDTSSLQLVWWPGPLAAPLVQKIRKLSKNVGVSYGMTEASGGITFSQSEATDTELIQTVGKPHPGIEVKLQPEEGLEGGEILLRGSQLMMGYWRNADATSSAFDVDGWFRSGDLGEWKDGNLRIVGRKKELIRSGGYNLAPAEIELELSAHKSIAYVVVVGAPDPTFGEAAHAVWVANPGCDANDQELRVWLKERLASYKVPKVFWQQEKIPFLANGKVDRAALRRQVIERIGQD